MPQYHWHHLSEGEEIQFKIFCSLRKKLSGYEQDQTGRVLTRTAKGALLGLGIGALTGNAGRGAGVGALVGASGILFGGKKRSRRLRGGKSRSKTCPSGTYRISKKVNGRKRKVCSRVAYARRNGTISGGDSE
jgi:hypothetical protein